MFRRHLNDTLEGEVQHHIELDARSQDVFSHTLARTVLRTGVGAGFGVAIAIAAGRILKPLVFEISTRDVTTYVAVASILLAVAAIGAAVPAMRAARVNPAAALREE